MSENRDPALLRRMDEELKRLDEELLFHLPCIVKAINEKQTNCPRGLFCFLLPSHSFRGGRKRFAFFRVSCYNFFVFELTLGTQARNFYIRRIFL